MHDANHLLFMQQELAPCYTGLHESQEPRPVQTSVRYNQKSQLYQSYWLIKKQLISCALFNLIAKRWLSGWCETVSVESDEDTTIDPSLNLSLLLVK